MLVNCLTDNFFSNFRANFFSFFQLSIQNFLGFSTFAPTFFSFFNFQTKKKYAEKISARASRARSVVRECVPMHVLRRSRWRNRVFFRIWPRSSGNFWDKRTFEPEKIRDLGKMGIWLQSLVLMYVHYSSVRNGVNRYNVNIIEVCSKREPDISFFKTLLGALPPPRGHPPVARMCQKVIRRLLNGYIKKQTISIKNSSHIL
jgi:hypothetical protein